MRHRIGIRELRDSLSRWVDRVKEGDEVVVTDHGKPVARLHPYAAPASGQEETEEECLARLVREGKLLGGAGGGLLGPGKPIIPEDVDIEGAVYEDREERDLFLDDTTP